MRIDLHNPAAGVSELAGGAEEVIRSEPGLGWLFAQALYLTQPVLEAFWTGEQIRGLAETCEGIRPSAAGRQADHS